MRIALMLALLAPFAAANADLRIALDLRPREWIGASVVADDASGAIVITGGAPRSSRLIRFDARGHRTETTIDGISVNALQSAGTGRHVVHGAIGSGGDAQYVARLIELTNGSVVTRWDSTTLGSRVTRNEDAVVTIDSKGERWAALVPSSTKRFDVLFGHVAAAKPAMTYHFENDTTFANAPPEGFSGGSWELVSLRGSDVAVLTPAGSIYVVSAESGVKTILSPERGGSHLEWDVATETLWVESGIHWTGYSLKAVLAAQKEKDAKPVAPPAPMNDRRESARPAGLAAGAVVTVSPSARAVLILPTGPRSREVIVRPR